MSRRRVAVTGMGVVCATGTGVARFRQALFGGQSGLRGLESGWGRAWEGLLCGAVPGLVPPPEEAADPSWDRTQQAVLQAVHEALEDSGRLSPDGRRESAGLVLGTVTGSMRTAERVHREGLYPGKALDAGMRKRIRKIPLPALADAALPRQDRWARHLIVNTACASGTTAVGVGMEWIRRGEVDWALVGGADGLSEFVLSGFQALRLLTPDRPRPFDRERSGFCLGEGAAFLVLEDWERARARGARIYAEVAGFGSALDASHVVKPDPDGRGLARAVRAALEAAGVDPREVDAVNAHGTATPYNDAMECRTYEAVFGDRLPRIPVSAIKPVTGHALGASGALEAVASVLTLVEQKLPPTLFFAAPDPACPVDCVPHRARPCRVRHVLSVSAGFMGHNAALLFREAGGRG